MRSLLNKLVMVLILISAWVAYDNWHKISEFSFSSIKNATIDNIPALPSVKNKSTVYQWKDRNGKVHVSNTPPVNAKDVEIVEYDNNMNVVAPTPIPEKIVKPENPDSESKEEKKPGLLDKYGSAIKDAKNAQKLMNKRNSSLQEQLQ